MKRIIHFLILMLFEVSTFSQTSNWIPSQSTWLNNSYTNTIVTPTNLLDNNVATNGYLSMSYYSTTYTKEMYIDFGTEKTIDGFKFAYIFPNCTQGACSSYPGPIYYTCKGSLYYKNQNSQWISAYTCPNLNANNSSMVCPMEDSVTFTFTGISAQEWKFEMIGNYYLGGGYQTTTYYRVKDIYFREYSGTGPNTQATNITFSNIQTNQITFDWTDGNGSKRAVFIKQDSVGTPVPVYNTTYTANTTFGSGTQIGTTGWYCVFNGTSHASGVTVTNLLLNTNYRVMVCEYNGDAGLEQYNITPATNNPKHQLTSSSSNEWTPVISGTMAYLSWVHFPDDNTGYAVGSGGTILKTTDAGLTWSSLTSGTTTDLFSVHFENANLGYVSGNNGIVLKTSNGGSSWTPQTSGTGQWLRSVFFTAPDTGYVVGGFATARKTVNGGSSWNGLNTGQPNSFVNTFFTSPSIGYAVGFAGTIRKTTDGGINWSGLPSGTINELSAVYFPTTTTGYVVGGHFYGVNGLNYDSSIIRKTINAGLTWLTQIPPSNSYLTGVYFTDVNTGYAVGTGGKIYNTVNGGVNWTIQPSGTTNALSSVYFPSPNVGIIVGDSGTILRLSSSNIPEVQATNITFSNVQTNQLSFNWTNGNGSSRAVFIKQDSVGTSTPINSNTYTANTVFGSGSQIGTTSWYCVFNGSTHSSGVTVTGLQPNTNYRVMVCEYNGVPGLEQYNTSIAIDNPKTQKTTSSSTCGTSITVNHIAGTVAPVNKTVTYSIVTGIPGELSKCWITSNLGSDHQADSVNDVTEASAGWYWQFNRKQGYKLDDDGLTRTPNMTWITPINENLDWQTVNDPCAITLGTGWRIPTKTEWENVDVSGGWTNWNGPWNSLLKIHAAGHLNYFNGSLETRGLNGDYWSSIQTSTSNGGFLNFTSGHHNVGNNNKAYGMSLRCLKNIPNSSPTIQSTNVNFTSINTNQFTFNWTDGNGSNRAVFIKQDTVGSSLPVNDMTYTANTTFGSGTQIGTSGWYCVFNGTAHGSGVNITNLIPNTNYRVMVCEYNGAVGVEQYNTTSAINNPLNVITQGNSCPGIPIVLYGGQTYNTVLIGTQCWFKENLNIGTRINGSQEQTNNSSIEKYCYNDLESNCNIYGGLYQWNEMMQYVNIEGVKGICPNGWHIPKDSEWTILTTFLGGENTAGGKMKETGTVHWSPPNTGATNSSGFTALASGWRSNNGNGAFGEIMIWSDIWSSTQYNATTAWYRGLIYSNEAVLRPDYSYGIKIGGFAARCLKDTCTSYSSTGVSTFPSANPVCSGTSVTFTATPTNGGTTPYYQWKVNGTFVGTNSPTYSYIPTNNDAVTCIMTSSTPCASNPAMSNSITMTVNQVLPVSVSISTPANPVCAGSSVTYTTIPTNGGTTPTYQWNKGGTNITGATNSTYTYIPTNGNVITCVLNSNAICPSGSPATSNSITMTVNQILPVSVAISTSSNPVCAGSSVTNTATPTNGGTTPSYQWKKGGANINGATNSTYNYIPANNDVITCGLTSTAQCITGSPATSNAITMTVNQILPVSVSINASANPVCTGASVTYTATPTNGVTTPTYQWKKGGTNIIGATNSTYTYIPTNGNVLTCILNSNATCPSGSPATSNSITMTVNPIFPVSVAISASANPVCVGTSVTFTATPSYGGTTPVYQWKKGGTNINGATNSTYNYIPANNDLITCMLTSNAQCITSNPATSNTITMIVNPPVTVSVMIFTSGNYVCDGTSVSFIANATNGGNSPVYQWKVNGNNVGSNGTTFSYVPANNDAVTCTVTSNAACASGNPAISNTIHMFVAPTVPVSVSIIASSNPFCIGNEVVFTATPTNGGSNPIYQWILNGGNAGTNSTVFSYTPVNDDVITCRLTSDVNCASGNPATSNQLVMSGFVLNPTITGLNTVCLGTGNKTYTTEENMIGYDWNVSAGGEIISGTGTNTISVNWNTSGSQTISIAYGNSMGCSSSTPTILNVNVIATPDPAGNVSGLTEVCVGTQGVTYSVNPILNATNYLWKVPLGLTIASGAGTNLITVNFPSSTITGAIYVKGTNVCFTGVQSPNLNITTNALLTGQASLSNITIPPAQQECLAAQSITTAGLGTTFLIESGGEATLIASQFIRFLPGTTVQENGLLHGYITTQCIPCNSLKTSLTGSNLLNATQTDEKTPAVNDMTSITVYPNPTSGSFTLEFDGEIGIIKVRVEIYSLRGEKLLTEELCGEHRHVFSLNDKPVGVYFIRVITGTMVKTVKVIKQ